MKSIKFTETTLRTAYASKLAYSNVISKHQINKISKRLYGEHITDYKPNIIQINQVHCYVTSDNYNNYLIAFKGSSSVQDIFSFLDMDMEEFKYKDKVVKIHSGTLLRFRELENEITTRFFKNLSITDKCNIIFTGHSSAGCLACLASSYYSLMFDTHKNFNISCYTFGSCRVGDENFNKWYENQVKHRENIINKKDFVYSLPIGYENINNIVLDYNKDIICNPIVEHNIDTYIENIEKNIQQRKIFKN